MGVDKTPQLTVFMPVKDIFYIVKKLQEEGFDFDYSDEERVINFMREAEEYQKVFPIFKSVKKSTLDKIEKASYSASEKRMFLFFESMQDVGLRLERKNILKVFPERYVEGAGENPKYLNLQKATQYAVNFCKQFDLKHEEGFDRFIETAFEVLNTYPEYFKVKHYNLSPLTKINLYNDVVNHYKTSLLIASLQADTDYQSFKRAVIYSYKFKNVLEMAEEFKNSLTEQGLYLSYQLSQELQVKKDTYIRCVWEVNPRPPKPQYWARVDLIRGHLISQKVNSKDFKTFKTNQNHEKLATKPNTGYLSRLIENKQNGI